MRVLIVEDNRNVASALKRGLGGFYAIDVIHDSADALLQSESVAYDAILLDLILPGMGGDELCKELRATGNSVPIIIIGGENDMQTKTKILDMGADDYIAKPCNIEEICARLRAVLRRTATFGENIDNILIIADLELNIASRVVKRGEIDILLRRKEFDLLEYLMRNKGRVVTRSMIIEHIWDMNEDLWTNVVDVHIKNLRDKIDKPFSKHMIETVRGVGYKLDGDKVNTSVA